MRYRERVPGCRPRHSPLTFSSASSALAKTASSDKKMPAFGGVRSDRRSRAKGIISSDASLSQLKEGQAFLATPFAKKRQANAASLGERRGASLKNLSLG